MSTPTPEIDLEPQMEPAPKASRVWRIEWFDAETCALRLNEIEAAGGYIFQVNSLQKGFDIIWYERP